MDYSFRCEAKRRQNHQHSLEVHLVAGNVADVRCLVSQRLAGSGVLVGLVLGLLGLCREPTVSDDSRRGATLLHSEGRRTKLLRPIRG